MFSHMRSPKPPLSAKVEEEKGVNYSRVPFYYNTGRVSLQAALILPTKTRLPEKEQIRKMGGEEEEEFRHVFSPPLTCYALREAPLKRP